MPVANLQLVCVTDIARSTALYSQLFEQSPVFTSPRYVAFATGPETLFALWSGGETPAADAPRFAEIGLMLPAGEQIDDLFARWSQFSDLRIVRAPYTDVFGRTFLVADPDGHVIRVCRSGRFIAISTICLYRAFLCMGKPVWATPCVAIMPCHR